MGSHLGLLERTLRLVSYPIQHYEKVIIPKVTRESEATVNPGSNKNSREAEQRPGKSIELSSSILITTWGSRQ